MALQQADRFINNPQPPLAHEAAVLAQSFSPAERTELALGTGLFHGFSKMLIALGQEPDQMDLTVLPTPAAPTSPLPPLRDDPHVALLADAPDLAARWGELQDRLWSEDAIPGPVLELCRQRMAAMLGVQITPPSAPQPADPNDPLAAAALTMAELFVLDVRSITRDHLGAVVQHAGADGLTHLCVGLAVWDGIYRLAACR